MLLLFCALMLLWLSILLSRQPGNQYGFQRRFFLPALTPDRTRRLSSNQHYFAGFTASGFYLGNYLANAMLIRIGFGLNDTNLFIVPTPDSQRIAWGMSAIRVDSPVITLYDRLTPAIIRLNTDQKISERVRLKHLQYSMAVELGNGLYVLRTFDEKLRQDVLETDFSGRDSIRRFVPMVQGDGRFSIDGMFASEAGTTRVFYIYFYRNEFNCFDSSFRFLYSARTIDTNRTAKVIVFQDKRKDEIYLSKPPPIVNAKSFVAGDRLFIYSPLKSDNEPQDLPNRRADLDVYSVIDGSYQSTCQLLLPRSGRITDIVAYRGKIFVLQNEILSIYTLPRSV